MIRIMKSLKLAALAISLGLLFSGAAHAIPVPFEWIGSSIEASGAVALTSYSPNAGSTLPPLDTGQSQDGINFGDVSVFLGKGEGTLSLSVDFITPESTTGTVTGPYTVYSAFFFSGGTWTGGSTDFAYDYMGTTGMARLDMNPIDIPIQHGYNFSFVGSITNLGSVPLSEPGTLSLLAFGLAGAAWVRRRKFA